MKPLSRAMLPVLCAVLGACSALEPSEGEALRVSVSLAGDACGVVSASATVTAADMAPIGPVPLVVSASTIQGLIAGVPAGAARTVTVRAYDARVLVAYEGSTQVDVLAGRTVSASLVLARNVQNCPAAATGNVEVIGTLESDPPPEEGVLQGPELAFSFADAALTSDGVVHFFDAQADRIRRLDLATRTILPAVGGSLDAVSMAVAPDGSVAYLGYVGGRIDAFDLRTGTSSFFGAAPATVSSMVVAGGYLFTIDDSGAWDSHSLYDRATGARVASADWRNTSRSIVYSPLRQKVFFLDSGVSPTDVSMVPIDAAAGTLGAEVDSPYHGDYALPNPLRLLPDESGLLVGSGLVFEASDLTYRTSLGLSFVDVAFLEDRLFLVDTVGTTTQLRVLNGHYDILAADWFPGQACRLFAWGGELVLVTQGPSSLQVRFITP